MGKLTAQIGMVLLYALVISKSLYFILKQLKLKRSNPIMKVLGENNKYQREMGLIIFNFIFVHGLIETAVYVGNITVLVFEYLTALIPTIILIYMEFTSFRFSQKMIKTWKKTHSIVWFAIPFILLHVALVEDLNLGYIFATVLIFILTFIEIGLKIKKGQLHFNYMMFGIIFGIIQFFLMQILIATNLSMNSKETQDNLANSEATTSETTTQEATTQETTTQETTTQETTTQESTTGTTYTDGTYTGTGYGHRGPITVQTTVSGGQISDVTVTEEREDYQWWNPVEASLPAQIVDNNGTDGVQMIAGSTHSSEGLIEAVDDSLSGAEVAN